MYRTCLLTLVAVAVLGTGTAHAQLSTSAYAFCGSIDGAPPDSFYVIWTTYDLTGDPYLYPDWVGYDVLRRPVPGCGSFEQVNTDFIPRVFGTYTHYFGGVPPSSATLYEYIVRPVDADHQPVSIPGFCAPCVAYATCTPDATPFTIGTLTDLGWAVLVNPCPGTCYPAAYVEGPQADPLRPYAGTSTTVRLYGTANCGTVEGCALTLDHFDLGPCGGVVPAAASSWGRVKIRYR
jgi:hypothetical protein